MLGLSSLALALSYTPNGGGAPVSYDYTISSDADWTTVLAAITGGETVGVDPGTYSARIINTVRPSTEVVFTATNTSNKPLLHNFDIRDCANLTLEYMDFVSETWNSNPTRALGFSSVTAGAGNADIILQNNVFRVGYQGDLNNAFDVTKDDYPEYCCILLQFNTSTGAVTGFIDNGTFPNPSLYCGLADGAYALTIYNVTNYVSFSTPPVIDMNVVGGYIVSLTITNAGVATTTLSGGLAELNTSYGALSRVVTWAGHEPMLNYLARAISSVTGGGLKSTGLFSGPLTIQNNEFGLCVDAIKFSSGNKVIIHGNDFNAVYADIEAMSYTSGSEYIITNNFVATSLAKTGQPFDPHGDKIMQGYGLSGGNLTVRAGNNIVAGNIFMAGAFGYGQGVFLEGGTSSYGWGGLFVGNIVLGRGSGRAYSPTFSDGAYFFGNVAMHLDPTEGESSTQTMFIGTDITVEPSIAARNVLEKLTVGVADVNFTTDPNLQTGLNSASLSGADATAKTQSLFPNFFGSKTTRAEVAAALELAAGYSSYALPAGLIDYAGKTYDLTNLPVRCLFETIVDQTTSASVSSAWTRCLGGAGTITFSVSGADLQIADDASGTNATTAAAFGSFTLGDYCDKFLRVTNLTTSASPSDASTVTVALNGTANTFTAVTATSASFPVADNTAVAYNVLTAPATPISGLAKMLVAMRIKADTTVSNAKILADRVGTKFNFITTPSAGEIRVVLESSANVSLRFVQPGGLDTNWNTYFFSVDYTQTSINLATKFVKNHSFAAHSGSSETYSFTDGTHTFSTDDIWHSSGVQGFGLFAEADGGGTKFDGQFEWLWIDFFTALEDMPDIGDPLIRTKFSADNFGSDGSVSGFFSQPYYFWRCTSAGTEMNSGITNLGSQGSSSLAYGGGTWA